MVILFIHSGCIVIIKPVETGPVTYSPTLSSISNASVDQNSSTPVTVSLSGIGAAADAVVSAQTVTVTATSSNTTLLPDGNITVTYTAPDTTGSLSLSPVMGQYGRATVTVTVTEGTPTFRTVSKTFVLTVNSIPGWYIGAETSAGWNFSSTDMPAFSYGGGPSGHTDYPNSVYVDSTGTYLYTSGQETGRIFKFNYSTGAYLGWTGLVRTVPTGGDSGCTSVAIGETTPGWCIGGTSNTGTSSGKDGGFSQVTAMVDDGTYLYVVDSQRHRVAKINASTGQAVGWIGGVATTPTGGVAGCTATAAGSPTPGWCTGGDSASGTYYGGFSTPYGIALTGGYLYVSEAGNHRINKIDATTGAMVGWSGRVNSTVGLGGPGTCAATATNSVTPDWCTGGTSKSGSGNGAHNTPRNISVDGTYIYVSESGHHRVQRHNISDGTGQGWIGRILTTAGMAPAGCVAAGVGATTPVWCTSGTSQSGTSDGHFDTPYGVTHDGTYLYIAEFTGRRIQKWDKTNGTFVGWVGAVNSVAGLGGGAGCAATTSGAVLPGWCTGGTSLMSSLGGGFYIPTSLYYDSTNTTLISVDRNGRFSRFNPATGAFVSSFGARIDAIQSAWTKESGKITGAAISTDGGFFDARSAVVSGGELFVGSTNQIQKFNVSTGAMTGWIGYAQSVFGIAGSALCTALSIGGWAEWCTGGIANNSASGFDDIDGLTSDGTYLYAIDDDNRIYKINQSTGALVGWIGRINSVTGLGGAAGCAAAVTGTFTPGWCTGGTTQSGTDDGMLSSADGITNDGTYLYVSDSGNYRISKYNASTGAFVGWIGRINSTVGLGGAAGCAAASTGDITPGWCTGGTSQTGSVDGAYSVLRKLAVSGGKIYVATKYSVSKIDATTGVFEGWIGEINSTAGLGGAAGCATAATGDLTPGWCTGGSAASNTTPGAFRNTSAIYTDGTYLYTGDISSANIQKFNLSTGSFVGWRGTVATTPTGGDTDCASTAVDSVTPGWCTGGRSIVDARIIGGFEYVNDIAGDANYLYVVDLRHGRITRVPK